MNDERLSPRERRVATLLALASTLLVVLPIALGRKDSFPLSTYPMFAVSRGNPELIKLVAITEGGEQVAVPPALLGTKEVLQAKAELKRIAHRGAKTRRRYCAEVAQRVAGEPELKWRELQLQRARFNPIAYFENGHKPMAIEHLATCPVPSHESATPKVEAHE